MILAAPGPATKLTGRTEHGVPPRRRERRDFRNATRSQKRRKGPCVRAWDGDDGRPFVRCKRDAPAGSLMIGLVLVTHGRLAAEFRSALEHVVGPQKQIEAVTIGPDDDVE